MVRTGKILFIVLSLLLILMLALAGILSPSWLFSPVYIVVYLLYALSSLLAAVLAPGFLRKTLHLLLALLIAGVVAEKSFNERRMIPMGEGDPTGSLPRGTRLTLPCWILP
ncbi:MAG: hypothetical protein U5N26_06620 [Candidatus Marinimicrobia bacterium]|nr:hypothetical protein [Candidatus Neomarinimicrobiota bacterium]